jgi:hypothetical protein
METDEATWMTESRDLAKGAAYADEVMAALRMMEHAGGPVSEIDLSTEYLKAGGLVAEERVIRAGYRLGAVLKELAGK